MFQDKGIKDYVYPYVMISMTTFCHWEIQIMEQIAYRDTLT